MEEKTIEYRVTEILGDMLGLDHEHIKRESKIVEDLGADSLDQIETLMVIEEEFDIEIPDEEAEKLLMVQDVINWIENHGN